MLWMIFTFLSEIARLPAALGISTGFYCSKAIGAKGKKRDTENICRMCSDVASELSKQESRWSCWHFCPLWFFCRWLFRLMKTAFYITTALSSLRNTYIVLLLTHNIHLKLTSALQCYCFSQCQKRITHSKNVLRNNWACARDKGIW